MQRLDLDHLVGVGILLRRKVAGQHDRPGIEDRLGESRVFFRNRRLGEHDVEGDHGGAGLGERINQTSMHAAGPRPLLLQLAERGFVDADDGDAGIGHRPHRHARPQVEAPQLQEIPHTRTADGRHGQPRANRDQHRARAKDPGDRHVRSSP